MCLIVSHVAAAVSYLLGLPVSFLSFALTSRVKPSLSNPSLLAYAERLSKIHSRRREDQTSLGEVADTAEGASEGAKVIALLINAQWALGMLTDVDGCLEDARACQRGWGGCRAIARAVTGNGSHPCWSRYCKHIQQFNAKAAALPTYSTPMDLL